METLAFQVKSKIREGPEAATLLLETADGSVPPYKAGQFLTLIISKGGRELRRSYSICSSPGQPMAITVRRVVNGEVSRWLVDEILPGQWLNSLPPAGKFILETRPKDSRLIFFIVAGSGIVPVVPLLRQLLAEEPRSRAVLIYQNRYQDHILFNESLLDMEARWGSRLQRIILLSRPMGKGNIPHRLTNLLLEQLIRSQDNGMGETLFYLCGPAGFMRMCQFTLSMMGYAPTQIRKEFFSAPLAPGAPSDIDRTPRNITLFLQGQTRQLVCSYPDTILQAARSQHILLPYSCGGGVCSSCMVKCLEGRVRMSINEVLGPAEIREGWVLTCVGYPQTDLVLRY